VSRPALGRGLDRLMEQPASTAETTTRSSLAPGLRILIQGGDATSVQPQPSAKSIRTPERIVCSATLLIADGALVLWPLVWMHTHHGSVGLLLLTACLVSVVLGGLAGVLAVLTLAE